MSHILEVTKLEVEFSGDGGKNISVDHVGFHVDSGEIVCIGLRQKRHSPVCHGTFGKRGQGDGRPGPV